MRLNVFKFKDDYYATGYEGQLKCYFFNIKELHKYLDSHNQRYYAVYRDNISFQDVLNAGFNTCLN